MYYTLLLVIFIIVFTVKYRLDRYIYINLFSSFNLSYYAIPRVSKSKPVYITLTTTQKRIGYLKYALSSILTQTRRVDEIRLYISKDVSVPSWLQELENRLSVFKIKRLEKDLGPVTKLLPALIEEHDTDCYLLYIDDDMIYHPCTVERLIFHSNRFPNSVICNSGKPYKHDNTYIQVVEGFGGVLVRPKFFNVPKMRKLIETYPRELFFEDDVYISGMLSENNIPCRSTKKQRSIPHLKEFILGYLFKRNPVSLSSTVNKNRRNFNKGLEYFRWKPPT